MTSTESGDVKKKMDLLGLRESVDYLLLGDISEQDYQHGGSNKKDYQLTPEAFKMCLMRAKRSVGQRVDPVIYVRYYLLLEKIFGLYRNYQAAYQEKVISIKDDKIDTLLKEVAEQSAKMDKQSCVIDDMKSLSLKQSAKMDEQSVKIDDQSAEIKELLGYGKDTTRMLREVQDDLTETKETVEIAKSYLAEKSLSSTMNPSDESKHHYFGATKSIDEHGSIVVKFITGQKAYVDAKIKTTVDQEHHEIAISPFYNANGIDLRQNVFAEFNKRREDLLKKVKDERKQIADEANQKLRDEIATHNRVNSDQRRSFQTEKVAPRRIGKRDVTVTFKKLSFKYKNNAYMSFEKVVQIILDVNGVTQGSPLP
jgi:hypothetical protein